MLPYLKHKSYHIPNDFENSAQVVKTNLFGVCFFVISGAWQPLEQFFSIFWTPKPTILHKNIPRAYTPSFSKLIWVSRMFSGVTSLFNQCIFMIFPVVHDLLNKIYSISIYLYMKSSDAKASKCHLNFSSNMSIFIRLLYLCSVIWL